MRKEEKGFTLIELLVVVAIIGILAAIAIPQFSEYRKKAFDARAKSDLHNLATAEEAYFAENETYTDVATLGDLFQESQGVDAEASGDEDSFTATTSHPKGSCDAGFEWDSAAGGFQGCGD